MDTQTTAEIVAAMERSEIVTVEGHRIHAPIGKNGEILGYRLAVQACEIPLGFDAGTALDAAPLALDYMEYGMPFEKAREEARRFWTAIPYASDARAALAERGIV